MINIFQKNDLEGRIYIQLQLSSYTTWYIEKDYHSITI